METQQQQQIQMMQERRGVIDGTDGPKLIFLFANSFNYLIPMLMGVLQVNVEGKNKSPFDTHPANMWVLVFSTVIYFFAAQRSIPAAIISGSLSSVSLLSVLLSPLLGLVIFLSWTFVPMIVAYQVHAVIIHYVCHRLRQMIMDDISKLSAVCTWFTRSTSNEQRRLPV